MGWFGCENKISDNGRVGRKRAHRSALLVRGCCILLLIFLGFGLFAASDKETEDEAVISQNVWEEAEETGAEEAGEIRESEPEGNDSPTSIKISEGCLARGRMPEGVEVISETSSPKQLETGFVTQEGELYYYNEAGKPSTGWFYIDGNSYCAREDGSLYKDGKYEIDGVMYTFSADGVCPAETEQRTSWKRAYIDLVNQYEAGQYDFEGGSLDPESQAELMETGAGYSLFDFDGTELPELVIQLGGPMWGGSSFIYTYDDDTLYKVGELNSGWHDHYCFLGSGFVVHCMVDGAGTVNYYSYYETDSEHQLVYMYSELLLVDGVWGDVENLHFYYSRYTGSIEDAECTEITEEEYNIYFEQRRFQNSFDELDASDADEIIEEINSLEVGADGRWR